MGIKNSQTFIKAFHFCFLYLVELVTFIKCLEQIDHLNDLPPEAQTIFARLGIDTEQLNPPGPQELAPGPPLSFTSVLGNFPYMICILKNNSQIFSIKQYFCNFLNL